MAQCMKKYDFQRAQDNSAVFSCRSMSFNMIITEDADILSASLFISLILLLTKQLFMSKAIRTFSSPLVA